MSVLYIQRTWQYSPAVSPPQVALTYSIEQDGYAYVDPPLNTYFTIDPPNDDGIFVFPTVEEGLAIYDPWLGGEIFATANTINNIYDSFVVDYPDGYTQIALTGKQEQSNLLDNVSALSLSSGDVIYSTGSSNTVGKFNTSPFIRGIMSTVDNATLKENMTITSTDVTDFLTAVPSAMTTTLSSYVTSSGLASTLGSYATSSALSSTLGSYVTTSGLTSVLSSYVTSSSLTSTLSGYATTGAVAAKFTLPGSGTIAQYIDGTGALRTTPVVPTNISTFTNDANYMSPTNAGMVYYYKGVKKTGVIPLTYVGTVNSSGVCTWYLTQDGTSNGTAAFSEVYMESINAFGSGVPLAFSSWSLSGTTLTATVQKPGTVSILGGALSYVNATSGTTINLTILGKAF